MAFQLTSGAPSARAFTTDYFDPTNAATGTGSYGSNLWDLSTFDWYPITGGGADVQWTDTTGNTTIANFAGGGIDTVSLNANLGAFGLVFGGTGDTIGGSSTVTLGAGGIDTSALSSGTTTISAPVALAASQTWNVGAGSTLAVGTLTDNVGGSVVFIGPATNTAASAATGQPAGSNLAATATITIGSPGTGGGAAPFGLLDSSTRGAYGTVGLYDWASTDTAAGGAGVAPYTIIGGSQVASFYAELANNANPTANTNIDSAVQQTPAAGGTNNLRFSSGTQQVASMRFNSGHAPYATVKSGTFLETFGVLVTPNMGSVNTAIDGLRLAGQVVQVVQNNTGAVFIVGINAGGGGAFFSNSNSAAEAVVKSGLGSWFIDPTSNAFPMNYLNASNALTTVNTTAYNYASAANSTFASFFLNGGVTVINNTGALGNPTTLSAAAGGSGTVNFNGGTLMTDLSNVSLTNTAATANRALFIGGGGGGLAAASSTTLTVPGVIAGAAGTGALTIGIPASTANGNIAGLVPGTGGTTANTAVSTGVVTPVAGVTPANINFSAGQVILSAANTYTGNTNVASGILRIDTTTNSAGTGTININNGGAFIGTGTLTNSVSNNGGGIIMAGDSNAVGASNPTLTLGSLNLNNGSILQFNFAASGANYDTINVTNSNALTIAATAGLDLFTQGSTGFFSTPGTYNLIDVAGGTSAVFTQSDVLDQAVNTSYSFADVSDGTGGDFVQLTIGSASVSAAWNNTGGSNWSQGLNWVGGTAPHSAGDTATFGTPTSAGGTGINAASVVSLDVSETVGTVVFNNPNSYTITPSGGSILTLDDGGPAVTLSDQNGNHSIGAPISLNGSLAASVANSNNTLTITSIISNGTASAPTLAMSGSGVLVLTAANTYGGGSATLNTLIAGGTLQLGDGTNAGSVVGGISIHAPGTLAVDPPVSGNFSNLMVGNGTFAVNAPAGVVVTVPGSNPSLVGSTIVNSGTLVLGTATAIGSSSLNVLSGALADLNGFSPSLNGLGAVVATTGGVIDAPTATVAMTLTDNQSNTTTFSGEIQNSNSGSGGVISLTMAGTGTLNLSGQSTYTGTTTGTGGTIAIIGPNGSISAGAGNVVLNGGTMLVNGGSLTTTGNLGMQTGSSQPSGFVTIGASGTGGNVTVGSTTIGAGSGASTVTIDSGTVSLGAFVDDRDSTSATGSTTSGLVVNNGTVTMTSARVGATNSSANMTVNGGNVTIGSAASNGAFLVGDLATVSNRDCDLTVTNGSLTYLGTDGLILANTATAAAMSVSGGNVFLTGISLNPAGGTAQPVSLTTTGGNIYLGAVGIVNGAGAEGTINLNGGLIGAMADWSSSADMAIGGPITLFGGDASNNAHNISLTGSLSGSGGSVLISGPGTVTFGGGDSYSGPTTVGGATNGTLIANGTISTSPVTVAATGTLAGVGTLEAAVTIIGTVAPGVAPGAVGPLNLTDGLTFGATGTFSDDIDSLGGSDELAVIGDIDFGAGDTLDVNVPGGGPSGGIYTIATYTGILVGTFAVTNLPPGYAINYGTGSDSSITLTPVPVPEPTSATVLGVVCAGMLARRRRRA